MCMIFRHCLRPLHVVNGKSMRRAQKLPDDLPSLNHKIKTYVCKQFFNQPPTHPSHFSLIYIQMCRFFELVLDANDQLQEMRRAPAQNDIGMVAWRVSLRTPECPQGREFILMANDITHVIGSFGPREDLVFARATELAIRLGLPRLYISANSGARIGLANEVKSRFKVEWNNPERPDQGFRYLYLDRDVYKELEPSARGVPVFDEETLDSDATSTGGATSNAASTSGNDTSLLDADDAPGSGSSSPRGAAAATAAASATEHHDGSKTPLRVAASMASSMVGRAKSMVGGVLRRRFTNSSLPGVRHYQLTDIIGREHGMHSITHCLCVILFL
jgi:hypothetical protein